MIVPATDQLAEVVEKLQVFAPAREYAQALAVAAFGAVTDDLDPLWLAWMTTGCVKQESGFGMFLRPRGPQGSGDWMARTGAWLRHPRFYAVQDRELLRLKGFTSSVDGPWAIPFDDQGCGRKLGQDDIGSDPEWAWLQANPSPQPSDQFLHIAGDLVQCAHEVQQLEGFTPAKLSNFTGDVYNAGPSRFGEDLAKGIDPDSTTTQFYGKRLGDFMEQFWRP